MTNGSGKSDRRIVPEKPSNNAERTAAERVEESGRTKGNLPGRNALRTQGRDSAHSALERVRQVAREEKKQWFTALLHHVYDIERLHTAFLALKRDAAKGVDGQTWRHYREDLENNLQDLSGKLKRGAYRAKPVRRVFIPKSDGRQRPLGVPAKHAWLVQFIEHRVIDKRIVRLIQKWLAAGVLEDGKRIHSEDGTVQGGSISPLLASIYLHYVFDLWVQRCRSKQARSDVIVVCWADYFVVGFQHPIEAEWFLAELRERFARFGLELHPNKTRPNEFGRHARNRGGEGAPETFNFIGFTHSCGKTRKGGFTVLRQTMRTRWQAKLRAVKAELRMRLQEPIPAVGAYLRSTVLGHVRYYGAPMNGPAIGAFRVAA
jgi:Reverse transcriptase (RNA-dependent DNA polymerase)